jgi:hypothetical protein
VAYRYDISYPFFDLAQRYDVDYGHVRSLAHDRTVRPIVGQPTGSKVGQVVGSYVWHPASREWRWLAIGVPHEA